MPNGIDHLVHCINDGGWLLLLYVMPGLGNHAIRSAFRDDQACYARRQARPGTAGIGKPMSTRIARTLHARWAALALLSFATAPALADDKPILSQMEAIDLSSRVARQVPGVTDLVIAPMPYEAANHRWVTLFKPNTGDGFIVTLDENSGDICALFEHQDTCAAKGSAKDALDKAKAVVKATEDARLHPPPDLEDLWLTVLLKMAPGSAPAPGSSGSTWYVSVGTGADQPVDLPATAIAKVRIAGIKVLPASAAPKVPAGNNVTVGDYHIGIGLPIKRPDGNYDVTYGYYCGALCAASITAVVSHDHWGWHIVSSRTNWVS
ncbi:MAG: hypothetical protein ABWX83_05025 [Luteibacter sp.]